MGALIATLATTVTMDVTGILLAGVVAALGLFIIPARRKQAKRELHTKIGQLRDRLVGSLRRHFEQEIEHSLQRINEAIAPYTRFVRAERDKNTSAQQALQEIDRGLARLEAQIREI
ncbi:MAG: hypothetical protein D6803_00605 [Anaerolineae bacterium]|nr:MAG: hypothetical protein D6803_00605 [Anaerolineae bacterium]